MATFDDLVRMDEARRDIAAKYREEVIRAAVDLGRCSTTVLRNNVAHWLHAMGLSSEEIPADATADQLVGVLLGIALLRIEAVALARTVYVSEITRHIQATEERASEEAREWTRRFSEWCSAAK